MRFHHGHFFWHSRNSSWRSTSATLLAAATKCISDWLPSTIARSAAESARVRSLTSSRSLRLRRCALAEEIAASYCGREELSNSPSSRSFSVSGSSKKKTRNITSPTSNRCGTRLSGSKVRAAAGAFCRFRRDEAPSQRLPTIRALRDSYSESVMSFCSNISLA